MRSSALREIPDLKAEDFRAPGQAARTAAHPVEVALLTGGSDRHYTFGLAMSLIAKGVHLDVIGSDGIDSPEMHMTPGLNFLNLRGDRSAKAPLLNKMSRVFGYYARLIAYAWNSKASIFHILWNNKFQSFDRTLLMLYYKILGKKTALTAHNVNDGRRDQCDSPLNRLTLRIQYHLTDHIFVHTEKMKKELLKDFGVREQAVTVVPYGINNAVPCTSLTSSEARRRLGIGEDEKTILFFGNIRPYKGLEYLVAAFQELIADHTDYRLVIAGRFFKESKSYWDGIRRTIQNFPDPGRVIIKSEFIPDEETELYFKASDVLVLPYTDIFQSGILLMAYSFGLPVVATDVGSFRQDVVEGRTGFVCKRCDAGDMAATLKIYFQSELFRNLNEARQEIKDYADRGHSWNTVAGLTCDVYAGLVMENQPESR